MKGELKAKRKDTKEQMNRAWLTAKSCPYAVLLNHTPEALVQAKIRTCTMPQNTIYTRRAFSGLQSACAADNRGPRLLFLPACGDASTLTGAATTQIVVSTC
eukprot:TRINITY_DN6725_c0_g2_i2.p1 TRINITY_DN6725_c0_g2~~TRINITY_DN6725_c0_g2_i2.p1  ORF type:complete len:102 (+),score=2.47 TRINITY_DN6725_c0_g2_i2:285-590(+)